MFPAAIALGGENWRQCMYDSQHSGNVPVRKLAVDALGLPGAVALTDEVFASPAMVGGRI